MNKHSRLITALLALIFCFSAITAFSITPVYAEGQVGEGAGGEGGEGGGETPVVDPEPVYTDPITPEPEPVYTDPVVPEPVYTDPVSPGDGGGSGSGGSGGGSSDSGSGSGSSGGGSSDSGSGGGNNDSSSVYYDSDGNQHANQSDVYVGGGQSYAPPVSTAPSVGLVKTEKNIDVNELSKNDWNDIKASLQKASKGGSASDGDDFSFIQKNTAKEDNGHMVFVLGLALVILSVAGCSYLIISAVMRRKKIKAGGVSSSGAHSAGSSHYRADNDYDDGYKASSKKASKFDTADIPNVKATKSKGGKRYR